MQIYDNFSVLHKSKIKKVQKSSLILNMTEAKKVYLLDAGNSQIKIALVQGHVIEQVERFDAQQFDLKNFDSNIPIACSSVINASLLLKIKKHFSQVKEITSMNSLPFKMAYQTPQTLGIDRLCNATFLATTNKGLPRLAIDLGTCIKFDFLNSENQYLGGSISPGLKMRARAMAHFTAKLNEIEISPINNLIGSTSEESLKIGTLLGWQKEIEGMLATYQKTYPKLVTYLTGGDAKYFDLGQKNGIFVHEKLTLEGLYMLYLAND